MYRVRGDDRIYQTVLVCEAWITRSVPDEARPELSVGTGCGAIPMAVVYSASIPSKIYSVWLGLGSP